MFRKLQSFYTDGTLRRTLHDIRLGVSVIKNILAKVFDISMRPPPAGSTRSLLQILKCRLMMTEIFARIWCTSFLHYRDLVSGPKILSMT